MANQLFSTDILKETLGPEYSTLEKCAINAGEAFMAGKITNIAFDVTQISAVQGVTELAATGLGVYGTAASLFGSGEGSLANIATTLSQQIISKVTQIVTSEVTQITTDYAMRHVNEVQNFPMNVQRQALNYFNENKKSVGEVIAELTKAKEDIMKEIDDQKEVKEQADFLSKMKDKANAINDKVTKFSNDAMDVIGQVTSYIENGPAWISDKVDKEINKVVKNVKDEVEKQWENDKKFYDDKTKALGEEIGERMTSEYNKALEKAQKKIIEMTEKNKSKVAIKAKSTIIKVKLQLMAKIGIS